MRKDSTTFGVQLDSIATINLRNEFVCHLHLMRRPEFREAFRRGSQIQTPFFTWHGDQAEALSLILQRAILGLES